MIKIEESVSFTAQNHCVAFKEQPSPISVLLVIAMWDGWPLGKCHNTVTVATFLD